MDANDLRTIITVVLFLSFIGIIFWAYSSRQKERFDEAANLPFADDDMQQRTIEHNAQGEMKESNSRQSKSSLEGKSHG